MLTSASVIDLFQLDIALCGPITYSLVRDASGSPILPTDPIDTLYKISSAGDLTITPASQAMTISVFIEGKGATESGQKVRKQLQLVITDFSSTTSTTVVVVANANLAPKYQASIPSQKVEVDWNLIQQKTLSPTLFKYTSPKFKDNENDAVTIRFYGYEFMPCRCVTMK